MSQRQVLDSMFHPRSVAVVGVSANPTGWGGTGFLTRLLKLEFPGKLYPVNPKADEIQGLKAYPDIVSLPEPPDLVIVAIPGTAVPQVLRDCVAAGVKNVHIFSSGFAETGLPEGRQLDAEITEIIGNSDLRVLGPNCMGVYVPSSRLTYWGSEPTGSGSLAFLSQSGGHAEMISGYAQKLGVYFSKMISFGNARGLQAVDLLEYLGDDPETNVIAVYLEGVSQGGRFTRLVREINRTKPVLVWKGGLTESGSRAVASHTGSLAGEERIWDAFFAQTGAVRVNSGDEIIDFTLAYNHLKPPRGRRVLLIGGGGGNSVAVADMCSREGLEVPRLSEATRQELNTFIRLAGNSARNPIDAWMLQQDVDLFRRTLEISVADPAIDMVIIDRFVMVARPDSADRLKSAQAVGDMIREVITGDVLGKPIVLSLNAFGNDPDVAAETARVWTELACAGVATYPSQTNAARALSRLAGYYQYQSSVSADTT